MQSTRQSVHNPLSQGFPLLDVPKASFVFGHCSMNNLLINQILPKNKALVIKKQGNRFNKTPGDFRSGKRKYKIFSFTKIDARIDSRRLCLLT